MKEEKILTTELNTEQQPAGDAPRKVLSRGKKRLIFYICIMALPILQFLVFYVYQNLSSILLAFRKYELTSTGYKITNTFENFAYSWNRFTSSGNMIENSFTMFVITVLVSMPLAVVFSFYIYKKCPLSGFFRVSLFLPQVISSIVFVTLYKYMVGPVYVEVTRLIAGKKVMGLLSNPDTKYGVVVFYNVWASFGSNVLMYTGTMSGIDDSLVESAQLDGANIFKEFIYITFPMIYRTYTTFLIVQVSAIFTSQMNLYTFFGYEAGDSLSTIGYDIYKNTVQGDVVQRGSYMTHPQVSAYGLILTVIVAPLSILLKKAMEKFGPSAN